MSLICKAEVQKVGVPGQGEREYRAFVGEPVTAHIHRACERDFGFWRFGVQGAREV